MGMNNSNEKEITLRGFVSESERDADGNVVAINILADDDDYEIELNELGVELFDFLDEDVEVTGILKKGRRRPGAKRIRVMSYEWMGKKAYDLKDTGLDFEQPQDRSALRFA